MRRLCTSIVLVWCVVSFVWAHPAVPTAAIRVDQAGYVPGAPKIAVVAAEDATGSFVVTRDTDGAVAFRSTLTAPVTDPDSGDTVRLADFSALTTPGRYTLEVSGVGRSWPFVIAADVFVKPFYLAMRSFYGQRCGTAVDLGPEFPGYRYDQCHTAAAYHPSSGRSGPKVGGNKGWHDAGDYGRYVVNSGITTGTLLWTYELYPQAVRDIRLNIPESGNAVPDILDEIRWNLDWMVSMQDTDGGVYHKQTSETFSGFVMPDADTLVSQVIGSGREPYKTTCATADFAAVMGIAARVYHPFDARFAQRALEAGRRAFAWALAHPNELFTNPPGVATGGYGDRNCSDETFWAAAELWRTTKEPAFDQYVRDHHAAFLTQIRPTAPMAWASVAPLGLWTYVLGGATGDAAATIRQATQTAANAIVARTDAHGYRMSLARSDYIWGSNSVAANYGVQLLVADRLTPDRRYRDAAADNLHYLLGRNPFSLSYVTHIGAHSYQHPHHRPSGADQNTAPWPGLLAGGPNARKQDPAMQRLPDRPPARMYLDDQESYASNEIAINWNAPLVLLLAAQLPHSYEVPVW